MKNLTFQNKTIKISFLLLITALLSSCYKQQVIIDRIPLNTPEGSDIFITGNFNNWDPGDDKYRMTRQSDGTYSITLPRGIGKLNYKFTRGDWTRVEKNQCGYDIKNRSLNYGEKETQINQVECWGDTEPMNCVQKVIVIRQLPDNTPQDALIYMACQFNNWNPGNINYSLQKHPKGFYYINIDNYGDCLYFKFTLGDWWTVETNASGRDIDNRQFCFDEKDTLFVKIEKWKSIKYKKTGKVTFVINKLPALTSAGDPIFLTGDFNNWNPGEQQYIFKPDSTGKRMITLLTDEELISYKVTRGNWKSVETLPSGMDIPNRTFINGQSDTVYLQIERWKDR
ncbi:MAG: hypothetical protein H6542_04435 [Lentimicrobiaceae bacterium]|nr:hypothetical protein [Lentimicrobiaceae bacterium]